MAYTTINKSSDHFNTVQWTGNASTNAITGVGFRPDWIWGKSHTSGYSHQLYDVVRGATYSLKTNGYTAQETLSTGLTSFDSDGFTLGSNTNINASGHTVTGWNWKAGNAQGSSNTDGSINTTYTSANTTSGFSISTYTGTGSAGTIGHGLGAKPAMIIAKRLTGSAEAWVVYHQSLDASAPQDKYLHLNSTDAVGDSAGMWNDTAPTTSVFSVGSTGVSNGSGGTFVAYCFAEKQGFSKFGKYTANGNANGAFVYTGFKPGFIMIKSATTAMYWHIFDDKRQGFNPNNYRLNPNATDQETTTAGVIDILSNGFKIRTDQQQFGTNGATYIYMAFAEAPLVGSNNIPATAR